MYTAQATRRAAFRERLAAIATFALIILVAII